MNITPVSSYNRTKQTPSFKAGLTIKVCKGVSGITESAEKILRNKAAKFGPSDHIYAHIINDTEYTQVSIVAKINDIFENFNIVSGGTNRKTLYHILDKYLEKEFPKHYK